MNNEGPGSFSISHPEHKVEDSYSLYPSDLLMIVKNSPGGQINKRRILLDPDIKLMLEFTKGEISAFEQIMNKYKEMVMNIAYRFLQDRSKAEDAAQEVFIKVYNAAGSYKPKAKLSTWLYKITAHFCLNELRSRKHFPATSLETMSEIPDSLRATPIESLEKAELKHLVREAISFLPDRQKMVVILQKYEGLSYQEISEIMGCSVSAVDSLLQRAKQNLKDKLAPFFTNKSEGL